MSKNSIIDHQVELDNSKPAFIYTIDGIVYCTDIDRWERMSENARNQFLTMLDAEQQKVKIQTDNYEQREILHPTHQRVLCRF